MADRPDLGQRARLADERVARRGGALGRDPQRLAHVAVHRLRLRPHVAIGTISERDVQHAVLGEGEARSEVQRAVVGGLRAEDHAHLLERARVLR